MSNNEKSSEKSIKPFLNFEEIKKEYEEQPKPNYLWNGIKEKSFGLIFGPPKSGKSTISENLAINIATGATDFFGYPLSGQPRKILFIGLEEYWVSRVERNLDQFGSLDLEGQELMNKNYLFQKIDFERRIVSDKDWENLEKLIQQSEAEIVFIDSITRMNPGKLENSSDAEKIMQKLRNICYDNGITLICIHHTPKMEGLPITMDKIKGSSVFAQESDFAVGVNKTISGYRYFKNVFFRYAPDDFENVKEFEINQAKITIPIADVLETEIIERSDRRRKTENREIITQYIDSNPGKNFSKNELVEYFKQKLGIKSRQVEKYLSELSKAKKIDGSQHGFYRTFNNN